MQSDRRLPLNQEGSGSIMSGRIGPVDAMESLDPGGNPTTNCWVTLKDGMVGADSVPSGASSRGRHGARALRDGDRPGYGGKGELGAVMNVIEIVEPRLTERDASRQVGSIHRRLCRCHGGRQIKTGSLWRSERIASRIGCSRSSGNRDHARSIRTRSANSQAVVGNREATDPAP